MLDKKKLKQAIDITRLTQVFTPAGTKLPWNDKTLEDNDDLAISMNTYGSAQNTASWHAYVDAIVLPGEVKEVEETKTKTKTIEEMLAPAVEAPAPTDTDLPDFEAMTKRDIDAWAKRELGLEIDGRSNKADMISTIMNELK